MHLKLDIKKIFPESENARYNVAAWQRIDKDNIVLVGREVAEAGLENLPDVGRLMLFEIDEEERVVHERVLWDPISGNLLLEDPRALVNKDGSITIGLTAVLKSEVGYVPYPATVYIESGETWTGELPPLNLIHAYGPGKNMTPIKKNRFLFRPERDEYHHKLLYFNLKKTDKKSAYDINFPSNLDWALWRIGTTMPPWWLAKDKGLLIIHGITLSEGKYVYSIGRALIYKKRGRFVVKVHPEPFITPDTFSKEGKPLERELHPSVRRVVYACGGVIKRKEPNYLHIYVNVGDWATYEVKVKIEDLKKDLF